MEDFSWALALEILKGMVPIIVGIVAFILFVILARVIIGAIYKWLVGTRSIEQKADPKTRKQWEVELDRQEQEEKEELLRKWRKVERLSNDGPLYEICNTGLYSPYEVELTDAEYDLVLKLKPYFEQSCILVDNYFRDLSGTTIQIDCIAVSGHGVFVFESKDYAGWIFGNGNQVKWTQVLAYGNEKYRFYNPIKQNAKHVAVLKKILRTRLPIYSVVVFGDNAKLKDITYVPDDCRVCVLSRLGEVLEDIEVENETDLPEVVKVCNTLRETRQKVTPDLREEHIKSIENAFGSSRIYG